MRGHARTPHDVSNVATALACALGRPLVLAWRGDGDAELTITAHNIGSEADRRARALIGDPTGLADGANDRLDDLGTTWRCWCTRGTGRELVVSAMPHDGTGDPTPILEAAATALLPPLELEAWRPEQERLRFILDNAADIIAVFRVDSTTEYVSPSVERVLGWAPDHFANQPAFDAVHPDDQPMVEESLGAALSTPGERRAGRFRMRHRDGHWVWLEARAMIAPGRTDVAVVSARDVSQEVEATALAGAEEARYRTLVESSPQGIVIHQDRRFVFLNAAACRILGAERPDDVVGCPLSRFSTSPRDVSQERFRRLEAGEAVGPYETTLRRLDGTTIDVELTSIPATWNGEPAIQVVALDLTQRRRAEALLEHSSLHDPLTGLPNRHLLADRVDGAIRRARRAGARAALFFCDLDQFKVINEALGHNVGDQLLVEVAQRLRQVTRETDTVARFGGDEFVVLSEELADDVGLASLAERIRQSLSRPIRLVGHTMHLTMSIGVVRIQGDEKAEEILSYGDSAMYAAKEAGRDRWMIFDDDLRERATDRLRIESSLRAVLGRGTGLAIHLQPEVSLASRSVAGYEALLRWDGPDGSGLPPDRFLPIAAGAGLMPRVGHYVTEQTVAAIAALTDGGPRWVAMNASPEELEHPDFARHVMDAMAAGGIDAERLCIEITENSIMRDPAGVTAALRPLRELGVTVAIDDFGTGYSSLSYLARFQPEFVKIDRSFTADIVEQSQQRSIVEAVLHLADSLDIVSVAEGVETETQAEILTELGCQIGQGWHFGRPVPLPEVLASQL